MKRKDLKIMKTTTSATKKPNYTRPGKPNYTDYDKYIGPRYSDRIYENRHSGYGSFDESHFSVRGMRIA